MIEITDSGGWKVKIERQFWINGLNFYLLRHTPECMEVLQPDGLIMRVSEGAKTENVKPTFVLNGLDSKQMMIALAEALETEGVKTPNDFKVQGLLEATRAHLADMRQLLKLK